MNILAIETSCDETGIALVEASGTATAPRFRIIKNIVSSQIPVHRPFGGVVPNLAKREHIKNLPIVLRQIFSKSQRANRKSREENDLRLAIGNLPAIDLIAVTVGPGLEPALWTGIEFAKRVTKNMEQATGKRIPLMGVNHLEGHLYSFLAASKKTVNPKSEIRKFKIQNSKRFGFRYSNFEFPAVALLVSGGHTILLKLDSLVKWKKLGETRDDAAGEAFDKVARMLGLPYPGGPEIAKLAEKGNPKAIAFPRPMMRPENPRSSALHPRRSASGYDFSFSGLKTAVLYYLRDMGHGTRDKENANVAASFQAAVVDVLVTKTMRAAREFGARSVILCGGVAANKKLRSDMRHGTRNMGLNFLVPPNDLNGDNAAMIAIAAYLNQFRKKRYQLAAQGNLNI